MKKKRDIMERERGKREIDRKKEIVRGYEK